MFNGTKKAVFNCSQEDFFKIIADYESYPQFLPEVQEVKILSQSKNSKGQDIKKIKFQVELIKSFCYVLDIVETPPFEAQWSLFESHVFKTNSGSWVLENKGEKKVQATYSLEIAFGIFVPKFILSTAIKNHLPSFFKNFEKRVAHLY